MKIKMKNIFYKFFWKDLYYNTKWTIINFFKYFKIVSKQRPWDYMYIIYMLEFQLKDIYKNLSIHSNEVDIDKNNRILKINRALELISNLKEDNYGERCGWKCPKNSWFEETAESKDKPKDQKLYTMKNDSKQTDEELAEIFKNSTELEKKEFDELFDILRDNLKGFWY